RHGATGAVADGGAFARAAGVLPAGGTGPATTQGAGDALLDGLVGSVGDGDQALQGALGAPVSLLTFGVGGTGVVSQRQQLFRPLQGLALLRGEVGGPATFGLPLGNLETDRVLTHRLPIGGYGLGIRRRRIVRAQPVGCAFGAVEVHGDLLAHVTHHREL